LAMVTKGVTAQVIDWSTWTPGMSPAAALVRPPKGLKRLLDSRRITISDDVIHTKLDRIGTSLATGLSRGYTPQETAKLINEVINDPQHALVIAKTETTRAVSVATRQEYERANVEQVEWLVAEGCEDCQENADASPIGIDETFPTGDSEPPAHPNCLCAIAPVFDDSDLPPAEEIVADEEVAAEYEAQDFTPSVESVTQAFEDAMPVTGYREVATLQQQVDVMNESAVLKRTLSMQQKKAIEEYQNLGYKKMNAILRTPSQVKNRNSRLWMDESDLIVNKEHIAELDAVFKRNATVLKEDILTFRGTNSEIADALAALKPGEIYKDKGFVSTTLSQEETGNFVTSRGYNIVIENPKGTKGIFPATARRGIITEAEMSGTVAEAEWMLPRNTKFEVLENIPPSGVQAGTLKVRVVQ